MYIYISKVQNLTSALPQGQTFFVILYTWTGFLRNCACHVVRSSFICEPFCKVVCFEYNIAEFS